MSQYYQKRIIAFIDILGFKTKIDDSLLSETTAHKLHTALKRILQIKLDNEENVTKSYIKNGSVI